MPDWTSPSTGAGLLVALLTGGVAALFVLGLAGSRRRTAVLAAVGLGGLGFQAVHFLEHGLQLGYWFGHIHEKPWLTPWADSAATGLTCLWGTAGDSRPSLGVESLHLLGNTIFMLALMGLVVLMASHGRRARNASWLRAALAVQGFHLAEHVVLTFSVIVSGEAMGLSTLFGQASGDGGAAYRVWFHFLINLAATVFAVKAALSMHGMGMFDRASEQDAEVMRLRAAGA